MNTTWAAVLIDVKNAFNSLSRAAMAAGIAALPRDGGREVLAYFLMLHGQEADLTYLVDGVAHPVKGRAGCTQGCSLEMQFFSLGRHPLLCDVAESFPDVYTILSIADDTTLIGPPDQIADA